jgi:two-component system, NarL family, invasion response regulator UvrY
MIRVAIVDDHAVVRAGLRQFLSGHIDLCLVAEGSSGIDALRIARSESADVMLLDLAMPDQSGVDALIAIKARVPQLAVLILSGYAEDHYATTLLRHGAAGYVEKDCEPELLVEAICVAAQGRRYITPSLAQRLAQGLVDGDGDGKPTHESLSDRELQVFLALARGDTIGHVAQTMFLSVKTVSTYRTRVMGKLGLASNSDLTYYALKNGLIH